MDKLKLGFAMTGSFCTWAKVLPVMEELAGTYDVFPILSPISYVSDNRFGKDVYKRQVYGTLIWEPI